MFAAGARSKIRRGPQAGSMRNHGRSRLIVVGLLVVTVVMAALAALEWRRDAAELRQPMK
jgi:hypothetical protein